MVDAPPNARAVVTFGDSVALVIVDTGQIQITASNAISSMQMTARRPMRLKCIPGFRSTDPGRLSARR
jgi:hypothetical protein